MYNFRAPFENFKDRLKFLRRGKKRGRPKKHKAGNLRRFGTLLILFGIVIAFFPFVYQKSSKFIPSKNTVKQEARTVNVTPIVINQGPIKIDPALLSTKEPLEPPGRIIIPSQRINLSVVEANVVNGYWEISETTASHGVGSANPGEIGNTVIFAHAREGLFLPLKDVKENDEIIVLTKERWYRYEVKEIKDVDPNQTEVIAPTTDETLTLYTCSGFLDNKRRIVLAKREF